MTDYGMALPRPMLATLGTELRGKDWTYEVRSDRYRALAVKRPNAAQLISRKQKDLSTDYPSVVRAIAALPVGNAVLDGEIVALDADGRLSFQALQHRRTSALALVY
jgi:bifunctional non-homologous end joining protein LigD